MVARVGLRIALFCSVAVSLVGCGPPEGAAAGGREATEMTRSLPQLVVFAYDRSTSISGHQLVIARQLTNDRLRKLDHGDRIAAHQLLQLSLEEPPLRWSQDVPAREFQEMALTRDSITRTRFLQDAQDYLIAFTDSTNRGKINGTDILSTLHDIAADLRAARGRESVLYIFSDMLQSTRTIEMEGLRGMPSANWVKRQKTAGTLPNLSGLCIVVVGARVDTNASQRVKRFWAEYFEATGAQLEDANYMLRPVTLPEHPCG